MRKLITLFSLFLFVVLAGYIPAVIREIPKTWDEEKLATMELPLADSTVKVKHYPADQYYQIPEMSVYKTYPVYIGGKEPPGYYDWLKQQEPEIIFDASKLKTENDWIKAGEHVFDMPVGFTTVDSAYANDFVIRSKLWKEMDFPISKDGIVPGLLYVVRKKGVLELGNLGCANCHTRLMPDGSILKGGQGNFPFDWDGTINYIIDKQYKKLPDSLRNLPSGFFRHLLFAAPWIKHESQSYSQSLDADAYMNELLPTYPGLMFRHASVIGNYPTLIPDLYNIQQRKYLDRTGLQQNRDIGDLMRYAALNQGLDFLNDYNGFSALPLPEDPAKSDIVRYSDEQLYALAKFIYSLKPPTNPNLPPVKEVERGRMIFQKEGCVKCHTPPYYSSGQLTPALGFTPSDDMLMQYDIKDFCVGTDPGLTLYTRRGTGFYKIPSLIGAWNRTGFLHSGYVKTLEEMFDKARLNEDYVPKGYKPAHIKTMAVKGHLFGLDLNEKDKKALIAFIRSL